MSDIQGSPCIARVLLNLSLDRPLDYHIPDALRGKIFRGMKVMVPLGKGKKPRPAYVRDLLQESPVADLKDVISICGEHPVIPDTLIRLGEWIANYYCCAREKAMQSLLPNAIRSGKIKPKTVARYYLADAAKAAAYMAKPSERRKVRIEILKQISLRAGGTAEFLASVGAKPAILAAMVKDGLLKKELCKTGRDPFKGAKVMPSKPMEPTPDQKRTLEKIDQMLAAPEGPHVLLLHGITCSGKTEVYLQAIGKVLENGGDAIVLVPEISLTPQTVSRFRARFGDQVSVLHSGLTDGERYDEWMKVHSGEVKIAVGARSALFAPFRNLKLIIVDEEHEPSYKQSEAPRYNARDVAVVRGKMERALVILGSATPSMESYHNAKTGKYELAEMLHRCDPSIHLPAVNVMDLRMEKNEEEKIPFFSKALVEAVRKRIRDGEQSILFLNKRGYSRQMLCEQCGFVPVCPDCAIPYTYHKQMQTLSCHLCGSVIAAYETCPQCGSDQIRYSGAGTERIELLAQKLFAGARIARMDSDTMTHPDQYEQVLSAFRRGDLDILIGTQMIAKGLDFPNVTLVGIINADMGLYLPDFRAVERSFQLLAQVAGRAGRGFLGGEVIVQTYSPFNPAIQCAATHSYKDFYEEEIEVRKELGYPPFSHLTALHFDGLEPEKIMAEAQALVERLRKLFPDGIEISDPAPAPIERIKAKFRFMAIAKGQSNGAFRKAVRAEAMSWYARCRDVDFYADVDALSSL